MILIIATLAFFIVTALFIIDMNSEQTITSEFSSYLQPFSAETIVKHNYLSKPEMVWGEITNLSDYNFWFPGVLRILPVVSSDRYVHKYSFDKFELAPGALIRLRPNTLSPLYQGRITSVEKNKKLSFEVRFNPVHKEQIVFDLEPIPEGTSVTCRRTSTGLFSWMSIWGFSNNKSKILDNLGYLIPEDEEDSLDLTDSAAVAGPQYSREATIARAVQAGLDGNMDVVNSIPDKPTRGMAKAMLVQSKRKGNVMPDNLVKALSEEPSDNVDTPKADGAKKKDGPTPDGLPSFSNQDDLISFVVNKALDGDDEPINAINEKPTRGKAKALLVKIKRGAIERPAMPELSETPPPSTQNKETPKPEATTEGEGTSEDKSEPETELIERLVTEGANGNMDEINALENKVLRGKIKAAIIKMKRASS